MSKDKKFSVLLIEAEGQLARQLKDFLSEKGLEVKYCTDGKSGEKALDEMKPNFVVIDLLMGGFSALDCLKKVKSIPGMENCKVIVTSKHNSLDNVRSVISNGAADYVVKPYDLEDMASRMAFQVQKKREYDAKKRKDDSGAVAHYFSYVDLMLREASAKKPISTRSFNLTKMLSMTVKAVRISLIQCHEDRQRGVVRASSDDAKIKHLEINIARYPEVQHVVNQEKIIVIENMANDPLMGKIQQLVKSVSFNSMVVAPVYKNGVFYGVLSTRFAEDHKEIANTDIKFCDMVANMLSMIVSTEDTYDVKPVGEKSEHSSEETSPTENDEGKAS